MFIIDSENRLIAAEASELKRWGYGDLYEAARALRKGELNLDREAGLLRRSGGEALEYTLTPVESLLGNWTLCRTLETVETAAEVPAEADRSPADNLPLLTLDEEPEAPKAESAEAVTPAPEEEEELKIEELLGLEEESPAAEAREEEPSLEEMPPVESADDEILPLMTEEEERAPEAPAEKPVEEMEIDELLQLSEEPEEKTPAQADTADEALELMPLEESSESDEELTRLISPEESQEEKSESSEAEEVLPSLDDDIEALLNLPELEEEHPEAPAAEEPEHALFPLSEEKREEAPSPETAEHAEGAAPAAETPRWRQVADSFQADLAANAEKMELSKAEYAELLREYTLDAETLLEELRTGNEAQRTEAAAILKDAVALLNLQPLDELIQAMSRAEQPERDAIAEEYERLMAELEMGLLALESEKEEAESRPESAVESAPAETAPPAVEEAPQAEAQPAPQETPVEAEAPAAEEEAAPSAPAEEELPASDLLQGVTPIPIEFSLHMAAEELNLPEDLVLEFINDFAKQGHEYLPVLIDAYESKDLDHLQKTAHMLKGAASNLRIEAMVDNLYDLQFDTDIERAPQRIRLFAGQLMSLDNYLKQMNS